MDKVYVIYFDGTMFHENGRKCAYLKEGNAKQVITSEVRRIGHHMYEEAKSPKSCWYDIGEDNKKEWFDKARARFEIRTFVEGK